MGAAVVRLAIADEAAFGHHLHHDGVALHRTADAEAWDAQISDFSSKVTRWTGNDTRVLEMSEIEVVAGTVASGGRAQDPVLVAIATEGLTIYGSTTWLRQLIRNRRTSRVKDQRL